MKNLNKYIEEAWSGVKQQVSKAEIEAWCEEMGIGNYTINDKGEIDVDDDVWLANQWLVSKRIKELPYKFGSVSGYFNISLNNSLISLKNCPHEVGEDFNCEGCPKLSSLEGGPKKVGGNFNGLHCNNLISLEGAPQEVGNLFDCSHCVNLKSLKGCPKKVGGDFKFYGYKNQFTKEKVASLCKVTGEIYVDNF